MKIEFVCKQYRIRNHNSRTEGVGVGGESFLGNFLIVINKTIIDKIKQNG